MIGTGRGGGNERGREKRETKVRLWEKNELSPSFSLRERLGRRSCGSDSASSSSSSSASSAPSSSSSASSSCGKTGPGQGSCPSPVEIPAGQTPRPRQTSAPAPKSPYQKQRPTRNSALQNHPIPPLSPFPGSGRAGMFPFSCRESISKAGMFPAPPAIPGGHHAPRDPQESLLPPTLPFHLPLTESS